MNNSKPHKQELHSLLLLFLTGILISCNTSSTSKNTSDKKEIDSLEQSQISNHCYLYTNNRDSIKLNFLQNNNSVEGTLHFKNYQIDGSSGTIKGHFEGDTLWLEYDFFAEGMHSNTEEVFLKEGNSLIRGVGEHEFHGDTLRYKNKANISFENGQTFHPTDCL